MKEKWFVAAKKANFQAIAAKFGIDQVTARLIRNRDVVGDAAVEEYLPGSLVRLGNPSSLKGCTKTPMEMMELIDETLTLAQSLLGRFNDTSASDLGVAFLSLKAGIQGAWLNVLINVGSLKDQEFAAEYRAKGEALLAHALPLADECYAEIVKLIEG